MSSHAPSFFKRYFFSTNHKDIGVLYLYFCSYCWSNWRNFFSVNSDGTCRTWNANFGDDYQKYNVWITSHGLLMIFFMIMPAMVGGFGNYFVPLLIGAPDMAFP